jgi:uncharacterized membrane protein YkgB
MSSDNVTDVVLGSVTVVVGTTVLRNLKDPKKNGSGHVFRPVVFGFMLATALLLLAIPLPGISKGLAYLSLVGAFVVNGPALFSTIGGFGK